MKLTRETRAKALKTQEGGRRSGRTYRMVQQALAKARDGQTVYLIFSNQSMAQYAIQLLNTMPGFTDMGNQPHVSMQTMDVQLPHPMGPMRFRTYDHAETNYDWNTDRWLGFPPGVPTFVDHDTWNKKIFDDDKARQAQEQSKDE